MKSFLTALIILVLAVSSIGLADAAETLPTANQCRTADASNKLLTPDKKYSAYEIFIQLRQGTFGDSPLNLPLMPVKNKMKIKVKRRMQKSRPCLKSIQASLTSKRR